MSDDKLFRVAICLEEGVVVQVRAESPEDAEEKAYELADYWGGSSYPSEHKPDRVHREFFTQEPEEIKDGN